MSVRDSDGFHATDPLDIFIREGGIVTMLFLAAMVMTAQAASATGTWTGTITPDAQAQNPQPLHDLLLLRVAGDADKRAAALRNLALVREFTRRFFDVHRKNAEPRVLDAESTRFPEVTIERAKGNNSEASDQRSVNTDLTSDIDAFIARAFALDVTPGMAVAVVRGDEVLYAKGFGFADREAGWRVTPDTQFYIASTTKSFTALAAAILAERKLIDLDAPLSAALPGVKLHPRLSAQEITLRDLLTHAHGISPGGPVDFRTAYTGEFTREALLTLLAAHAPAPGGKAFAYSNLSYNIFSLVLDAIFREGWQEVLDREVFRPLSMHRTTASISKADPSRLAQPYELRPSGPTRVFYGKRDANMHAAGGHLSTAHDLAKYLVAHLNGGVVGGKQILLRNAIIATHRQQVPQNRDFGSFHRFGWGLGWDLATYDGDIVLQRFGGFQGFHSHLSFMPERRIGVVVLANGGGAAGVIADAVATFAYDRVLNKPALRQEERWRQFTEAVSRGRQAIARDLATRQARSQATPLPLSAYAGTYESRVLGRMSWTLEDQRLQIAMGVARGTAEVFDGPRHQFRIDLTGGGSVVEFNVPDAQQTPDSLRFMNETFTRVR